MINTLTLIFHQLIGQVRLEQHRALFDIFNLDDRLTGLVGARGVGKTTLMLQYIKTHFQVQDVFYVSADHIYFTQNTLYEFIVALYQTEHIKIFFIDEIHKYPHWSQELKNIYDGFPDIRIVFSGSSSLELVRGGYDLSRRAKWFYLPGMSFREYLNLKNNTHLPVVPFDKFMQRHQDLDHISIEIPKLKGHFQDYLQHGFYPFYYEQPLSYHEKLLSIIDKTIFEDIADFYNIKSASLAIYRKLLIFLTTIPPGQINTHNLARHLGIDDKTLLSFLDHLSTTGLVTLIYPAERGNAVLRRPEKIFLNNTNLQYALEGKMQGSIDLGTIRELFFIQSTQGAGLEVHYSKKGDYTVLDYVFEIGGKNKTARQIQAIDKAFLVKDDILISTKRDIPLFYFGFLYYFSSSCSHS